MMSVLNNYRRLFFNNRTIKTTNTLYYSYLKTINKPTRYNVNRSLCSVTSKSTTKNYTNVMTKLNKNLDEKRRIYKSDVISALNYLKDSPNINSEKLIPLLKCCGNVIPDEPSNEKFLLVTNILELIQSKDISVNVEFYNSVLECYIDNKLNLQYKEFLSTMKCTPNEETYYLLLKCACELGDVNQGLEIVNVMKDNGSAVNERIFSLLILAHLRSKDVKSARTILSTMKMAKINITSLTYTELLRGYAELKDNYNFVTILNEAESKGELNGNNLITIVNSICGSENMEFLPMIKKSFPNVITSRTFQYLISNLCVRFIYLNKPEIAYATYKTLVDPEVGFLTKSDTYASTLLHEMAKANIDSKKIISIIEDLIETKRNEYAVYKTLESSLRILNVDLSITLLKYLHSKNIKLRNHYFWPILIHVTKSKGQKGLFEIFKLMRELDVHIESETLENYSLKYLNNIDYEIIISGFKDLNINISDIITSLCVVLLRENQLQDVVKLYGRHTIKLNGESIIKPLINAYVITNDYKNTITILKNLEDPNKSSSELTGQMLVYLFNKCISNKNFEQFLNLLENLHKSNVMVAGYYLDKIEYLSERVDENTKSKILVLSSRLLDVNHQPGNSSMTNIPHPRNMTLEQLECHLIELQSKKMETRGVLRKLIQLHCRLGNLKRVEELLNEFRHLKYKLSTGMKAGLLDLYIKSNKLNPAYDVYKDICETDGRFNIDEFKIIDLVSLFIANNKFKEGMTILKSDLKKRKVIGGKTIEANCWRLLNTSALNGNYEETKEIFNLLTNCNLCKINNVILGPLVKVHLNNGNLNKAVEEYVNCCNKYKVTPLQHELLCKLVDIESPTELIKQVVDATDKVHGINSAKMAIAACLAETGKGNTLREFILEQKIDFPQQLLEKHCNRWIYDKNILPLKMFFSCKEHISVNNLNLIAQSLMRIYYAKDEWEDAIKLWNELQDMDYSPPDDIKKIITSLLKTHNHQLIDQL